MNSSTLRWYVVFFFLVALSSAFFYIGLFQRKRFGHQKIYVNRKKRGTQKPKAALRQHLSKKWMSFACSQFNRSECVVFELREALCVAVGSVSFPGPRLQA